MCIRDRLYRLNVIYSYKYGDLSFVYPIARVGSSLLIALISIVFLSTSINIYGIGVRKAENGFTYIFWLFALNGVPLLIISIFSKKGLRDRNSYTIKSGIAAGFFATSSYALVVWGMQFIEIAYVSSIREKV